MRPSVIAFDVNETLSDLSPLGARFVEVGASASAAPLWFASVLRDGFALTAAGENPTFAGVARELLLTSLSEAQLNRPLEDAAQHVMEGFAALELHPDVANGVDRLHEDGFRLVTLSNGAASVADRLLTSANIRDRFERLLSVEDAGSWKPSARPYEYAAQVCEVKPEEVLLVAVHPWDVDGASRAGLQSAWVNRSGGPFPATFREATYTVSGIEELAELWE
ncbi:haloacid dehalogenase type II [Nocardioides panacis]|uniref:Haloacid dehalogenase type II n=1 Tax=Nocardioides panacis TaxID=2849501 RepID=A0A975XYL0_9ACTN|nr:haloacid dehalogenase type II [Nocardioides panacis]QWZ06485.1 haloacid dehalogenase type II [Nocardioides panacis]